VIISKIIFKNKKNYFDIFINKKHFKTLPVATTISQRGFNTGIQICVKGTALMNFHWFMNCSYISFATSIFSKS